MNDDGVCLKGGKGTFVDKVLDVSASVEIVRLGPCKYRFRHASNKQVGAEVFHEFVITFHHSVIWQERHLDSTASYLYLQNLTSTWSLYNKIYALHQRIQPDFRRFKG